MLRAHDQFEAARAQRSTWRVPWIVHSAPEEKIPLGLDCFSGGGRARNDGEDCSFARQVELAGFLTHRVPPRGGTHRVRVPCSGRACGSRMAARACELHSSPRPCAQATLPWSRSTVGSAPTRRGWRHRLCDHRRGGRGPVRGSVQLVHVRSGGIFPRGPGRSRISFRASDHREGRRKAPCASDRNRLGFFQPSKKNLNLGVRPSPSDVRPPRYRVPPCRANKRGSGGGRGVPRQA